MDNLLSGSCDCINVWVGGDGGNWSCSPATLYQIPTDLFDYYMMIGRLNSKEDLEAVMEESRNGHYDEYTNVWVSHGGSWSGAPSVKYSIPIDVFNYLQEHKDTNKTIGELTSESDLEKLIRHTVSAIKELERKKVSSCLACREEAAIICSKCQVRHCMKHMEFLPSEDVHICHNCAFVSCWRCKRSVKMIGAACELVAPCSPSISTSGELECDAMFCTDCTVFAPHRIHSNKLAPATELKLCGHICSTSSVKEACCPCIDKRPLRKEGTYPRYVDGEGWSDTAARNEGYCPVCKPNLAIDQCLHTL